jgi:hypothetical protein
MEISTNSVTDGETVSHKQHAPRPSGCGTTRGTIAGRLRNCSEKRAVGTDEASA